MTKEEKLKILSSVFSPTAPVEDESFFYGRLDQLRKLHNAINERGQHAVLYGDRGVGKTSLANIATKVYTDVIVSKITCNRTEDFKSLWSKAFRKITFTQSQAGLGFKAKDSTTTVQLDLFLPNEESIDSTHIESILEKLDNKLLFIFDEFDSIQNEETKVRMADTIKALSDNVPNVTILIVGIADSVIELIGNHPSIERCLLQINMPRMSAVEVGEIVDNGMTRLELILDKKVRNKVVEYSAGFPSYAHLLCKYTSLNAIQQDKTTIEYPHFSHAVSTSIENANQSLRDAYQKATISSKGETQFVVVIYACARAKSDEYNCFSSNEIVNEFNIQTGKKFKPQQLNYHINELCKPERGEILEKVGTPYKIKYKFKNPMMKALVRLKFHDDR